MGNTESSHLPEINGLKCLEKIGEGSFGKVYKAQWKGQTVAAKQLHKHIYFQDSVAERFISECETLRGLTHRNIVTMIDMIVPGKDNPPVLITELLDCDLAQHLKKRISIPLPEVVSIALDVAEGLKYLHDRPLPIAHRDLASKNVLLTTDGTAKIADLGLAKVLVCSSFASPTPGTPLYAAPETFGHISTSNGEFVTPEYDVKVDVFAFGVLLLEMITGHPPRPEPQSPVDEDGGLIAEHTRRSKDIAEMGSEHSLAVLVLHCMKDDSHARPTSREIVEKLNKKKLQINEKIRITGNGKAKLKVVTLGASDVGKTCIIQRFLDPSFDSKLVRPTVGVDPQSKTVCHKGIPLELHIEDTVGQERFRSTIPMYYRNADAVLLVFDVSYRRSLYKEIPFYIQLLASSFESEVSMVLVGNKVDDPDRKVSKDQGLAFGRQYCVPYIETSAKTGHNIEHLFETVVEMVYERLELGDIQDYIHYQRSQSEIHLTMKEPEKSHGCRCWGTVSRAGS